jgi:hypothetical protein
MNSMFERKEQPTMTQESNHRTISAEKDEYFFKLDVDNIVVLPPKSSAMKEKTTWINIKYNYGTKDKPELGLLKVQTPELFSFGISQFEKDAPLKMSFCMQDKKLREAIAAKEEISEEDKLTVEIEEETIKILEDVTEKIKKELQDPKMLEKLGKNKKDLTKWAQNVNSMEIVKRSFKEDVENIYVSPKIMDSKSFMKTKFRGLDDESEDGTKLLDYDKTVEKLLTRGVNCKATGMFIIDSVCIVNNNTPFLQIKLNEALISEFIEYKNQNNIRIPQRFRNRSRPQPKKEESDSDTESEKIKSEKVIISEDSDSD